METPIIVGATRICAQCVVDLRARVRKRERQRKRRYPNLRVHDYGFVDQESLRASGYRIPYPGMNLVATTFARPLQGGLHAIYLHDQRGERGIIVTDSSIVPIKAKHAEDDRTTSNERQMPRLPRPCSMCGLERSAVRAMGVSASGQDVICYECLAQCRDAFRRSDVLEAWQAQPEARSPVQWVSVKSGRIPQLASHDLKLARVALQAGVSLPAVSGSEQG